MKKVKFLLGVLICTMFASNGNAQEHIKISKATEVDKYSGMNNRFQDEEGLWYKRTTDSTVCIIKEKDWENYSNLPVTLVIPHKILDEASKKEYVVTAINDEAFKFCQAVDTFYISNSITLIGADAISGTTARFINVPNSVKTIKQSAFAYNESLKHINLPDSLTYMGEGVFSGCKVLKSVNIPKGLSVLGENCFADCQALQSIVIPEGVVTLGKDIEGPNQGGIFSGCTSLSKVTLPSSIRTIGADAFIECTNLKTITLPDGLQKICKQAFSVCTSLQSIILPNSIRTIEFSAFSDCKSLKAVTLPNRMNTIESFVFYNCTSLTSLTIPNSVRYIKESAFEGCTALLKVTIPNSVRTIHRTAFSARSFAKQAVEGVKNTTIYSYIEDPTGVISDDGVSYDESFVFAKILYVPQGTKALYQSMTPWNLSAKVIEMQ